MKKIWKIKYIIIVGVIVIIGVMFAINTMMSDNDSTKSDNFDGTRVVVLGNVKIVIKGIVIPEYRYINVETDSGTKQLAIEYGHDINEGDTIISTMLENM